MKKTIIYSALLASLGGSFHAVAQGSAHPQFDLENHHKKQYWITLGSDAVAELQQVGAREFMMPSTSAVGQADKRVSIAQISESQLSLLSRQMHKNHNRCGGYIVHDSLQSALAAQQADVTISAFNASAPSQQTRVNALLPNLAKENIVDTITYLSTNFANRYYTTSGGTGASDGLKAKWDAIVAGKSWANVSQISHSGYPQKSVMVTLTGSEKPGEHIVIGGHLDSTVNTNASNSTVAPGADDDASGIATLTEVMRVFVGENVQPKRTVRFIAYAAEEVGLRGSGDIAQTDKSNNVNVVGVMQLDMTNYKGSSNDIVFMTDYTKCGTEYLYQKPDHHLHARHQCGRQFLPVMAVQITLRGTIRATPPQCRLKAP